MFKLAFLVLIALTALLVVSVKFLPWWASLILIAALFLVARYGLGYALKRLLKIPFKAKGKVLSGATVRVHGIRRVKPPVRKVDRNADDPAEAAEWLREEQAEDRRLHWYMMDMTITPKPKQGGFLLWEPGELLFVGMDAKPEDLEADVDSKLNDYRILADGKFRVDDMDKHEGAQRIKFHVGLPPSIKQVQLRYYFELFGRIQLPNAPRMNSRRRIAS